MHLRAEPFRHSPPQRFQPHGGGWPLRSVPSTAAPIHALGVICKRSREMDVLGVEPCLSARHRSLGRRPRQMSLPTNSGAVVGARGVLGHALAARPKREVPPSNFAVVCPCRTAIGNAAFAMSEISLLALQ